MRETGLNKRATELRIRQGKHPLARPGASARQARAGSGLARASILREKLVSKEESDSGISADDRREIQGEIEKVARRNRIAARAEDFIVRPRRKGYVFPLVVNILAVALTVGAVLVLSFLFGRRDLAISGSAASMDTAEGKLLSELKRDSESKLLEKDKAITDFQSRIQTLDKERSDLAANIDEKVRTREADLRSRLQVELDAEKKRLADQGLSSAAQQSRLKSYETERTAALDKQLAEARRQADADKSAADERFSQLKVEYQKSVSGLAEERRRIQEEAQRNESGLRASMEATAKRLESQSAADKAGLDRAKAELARLEDLQSNAQAEEDRVIGLYGSIRVALRDRRYEAAADGADALSAYLKDPSLLQNAALQDRRNADLFVAETLGGYARAELDRASVDSGKLLAQADLLASARSTAAAAQAALKAGNIGLAQAKYGEALAKVPEILAAHQYILDQIQASEAIKRAALSDALAGANRDLDASRSGSQAAIKDAEARAAAAVADLASVNAELANSKRELAATQDASRKAQELGAQAQERSSAQSSSDLAAVKKTETGLRSDIADLKKELAAAQAGTAQSAATVDPAVGNAAAAAQAGEIAKLKAEVERLSSLAAKHNGLVSSYNAYLAADSAAPSSGDDLIAANARLDAFLGGSEAGDAMPGLRERVSRIEKAFQQAGQREVLYNALDLVDGAARAKDASARERYFKDLESRYAGDAAMLDFIKGLRKGFGG